MEIGQDLQGQPHGGLEIQSMDYSPEAIRAIKTIGQCLQAVKKPKGPFKGLWTPSRGLVHASLGGHVSPPGAPSNRKKPAKDKRLP